MRKSPSTGSDATEETILQMEKETNQYLSHIIVKLLLWSDGLKRLDDEERETLEEHLLNLNYPEFHM